MGSQPDIIPALFFPPNVFTHQSCNSCESEISLCCQQLRLITGDKGSVKFVDKWLLVSQISRAKFYIASLSVEVAILSSIAVLARWQTYTSCVTQQLSKERKRPSQWRIQCVVTNKDIGVSIYRKIHHKNVGGSSRGSSANSPRCWRR